MHSKVTGFITYITRLIWFTKWEDSSSSSSSQLDEWAVMFSAD